MENAKTKKKKSARAADQKVEGQERKATHIFEVDIAAYMPLLEDIEISDEDKLELLHSLYAIIRSFIDLGFRVETKLPPCGQVENDSSKTSAALRSHIYSKHQTLIENTKNAAVSSSDAAQKGVDA